MTKDNLQEQMRGVIVLPQRLLRESFAEFLRTTGLFRRLDELDKPEPLLLLCKSVKPEFVLLDTAVKGLDCDQLIKSALEYSPATKFLLYVSRHHTRMIQDCIKAGALGMISNEDHLDALETAVRLLLRGKSHWPANINQQLKKPVTKDFGFTDREWEVIQLVRESYTSQDIGRKLGLSSRTIEHIRSQVLQKLGLRNAPALIDWLNKFE